MHGLRLAPLLILILSLAACSSGTGQPTQAPSLQTEPPAGSPSATPGSAASPPVLLPQASVTPGSSQAPGAAPGPAASTAEGSNVATPTGTAIPATPVPVPATAVPAATAQPPTVPPVSSSAGSVQAAAAVPDRVGIQLVASSLTAPDALVPAPDTSGRLFVVDQAGLIRIIASDGQLQAEPFLDVRDRMVRLNSSYDERGLLGLAFARDFAQTGRFFVFYSAPPRQGAPGGSDNTMRLSEFTVAQDNPNRANAGSEQIIMQVDEPQANHEGGTIAFGPDGYLYISLGDGGGANDTSNGHTSGIGNGQDLSNRLGKILRIDVNSQQGSYAIPPDNPFKDRPAPEIYAYGLRNPYRFSFDLAGDHTLYAADAGQGLFEEVDIVTKGGNYGWNIREGAHCFNPQDSSIPPASCADKGPNGDSLIGPVIEYSHTEVGIAVVGGYIYRGKALPDFNGHYIFGDWSTSFGQPNGTLLVAAPKPAGQGLWQVQKLQISNNPGGRLGHFVLGFGQDNNGEVYLLTSDRSGPTGSTGSVYRIMPAG